MTNEIGIEKFAGNMMHDIDSMHPLESCIHDVPIHCTIIDATTLHT